MAVPKRRTSKSKQKMRRAHTKIGPINVSACPQCGEAKQPHHICKSCGTYNGRSVIKIEEE